MYLGTEIESVKNEVNALRQKQLELNMLISNLPEMPNESNEITMRLTKLVIEQLDLRDAVSSIVSARRIGKPTMNKPRQILMVVESQKFRDRILEARRKKKVTADLILKNAPANTLYFDEQLTRENRHLLYKARSLASKINVKFTWVKMVPSTCEKLKALRRSLCGLRLILII